MKYKEDLVRIFDFHHIYLLFFEFLLIKQLFLIFVHEGVKLFHIEAESNHIDNLVLTVSDIERSVAFYSAALEMEAITIGGLNSAQIAHDPSFDRTSLVLRTNCQLSQPERPCRRLALSSPRKVRPAPASNNR